VASGEHLPSSQRALTLAAAAPRKARSGPTPRSAPSFLAHLIATRIGLPQTRERRRAEPTEAVAAYRTTSARLAAARAR